MEKRKKLNVYPIQISIRGRDKTVEGQLIRTNAPRIVERILAKLPMTGRAMKQGNQLNLPIDIKMGKEKAVTKAKKGDIGYWPMSDALCIFLEDAEPYGGVSIIGNVTSNLDALMDLRLSTILKISPK
ncbi:MAG: cyclophilin-like fold protein [Candidatus Helarchaeota archaeon]